MAQRRIWRPDTSYAISAESGGNTQLFVRAPSDTMSFASEVGQGVDYYFFYGPEPDQIVQRYRKFTGAVPMLPKWAYGFWQCRERYSSQQQILDVAAEFRKRKIPVDVIVQDWQYWGKYGWNAMRFDENDYPDPASKMRDLHLQDFHMVISVWPAFDPKTTVKREFEDAKLLLAEPEGTNQHNYAADSSTRKLANSSGPKSTAIFSIWGWMAGGWIRRRAAAICSTTTPSWARGSCSLMPLFETTAVYDGQRATTQSKRVVILTRSAFAGQQRTGAISWSGDVAGNWDSLRRQIPAGLSFGMSGMPYWTTDIGGFFRPRDQYTSPDYNELLVRWFEFGTFCPIFRIHGFQSKTEMWNYSPATEKIMSQYDVLRYRLMPYLYSSTWTIADRGGTMMQGLPFVYPDDSMVREVDDQYLFGASLLINPVTQPNATTRRIVLPAADKWVDFWTGRTYEGGQAITVDAPLERIPILAKQGSIVPLGQIVQSSAEPQDSLEIRIYGGKDADFLLYEDSGDGNGYEHGARSTISFHWDQNRQTLSIGSRSGAFPGMPSTHTFGLILVRDGHGIGSASDVEADRVVKYSGQQMEIHLGNGQSSVDKPG